MTRVIIHNSNNVEGNLPFTVSLQFLPQLQLKHSLSSLLLPSPSFLSSIQKTVMRYFGASMPPCGIRTRNPSAATGIGGDSSDPTKSTVYRRSGILPAALINIHILLDVTLSVEDIHHAKQRNNPEDVNLRRNKG